MSGPERPQAAKPQPKPEDEVDKFKALVNRCWWLCGPVRGKLPHTTTGYRQFVPWKNGYEFGCPPGRFSNGRIRGDGRHRGIDIGGPGNRFKGAPVYSWGPGVVRFVSFDPGGYFTFVGIFYPSVNKSVDYGHLLQGSVTVKRGQRIRAGQMIGRIGTKREGLGHSHVHFRAGNGNWGARAVTPCGDEHPALAFNALALDK